MLDSSPKRGPRPSLSGLCTTCNRSGTCMYLRSQAPPIWRCEEFDDVVPIRRIGDLAAPSEERATASAVPGLCANCESFGTCTLPKTESGVWHCEEYR